MTSREERAAAIEEIQEALDAAEKKFSRFPNDPVHAAAIMAEEAGETLQAALDYYYGRAGLQDRIAKEAAQAGAMALRILMAIGKFKCKEDA